MILPESGVVSTANEEFATPETGSQASVSAGSQAAVANRYITVTTDVFELKIDRIGGNVVESSLLQYNETLNSKQSLKLLTNSQNRTYLLESGLIVNALGLILGLYLIKLFILKNFYMERPGPEDFCNHGYI